MTRAPGSTSIGVAENGVVSRRVADADRTDSTAARGIGRLRKASLHRHVMLLGEIADAAGSSGIRPSCSSGSRSSAGSATSSASSIAFTGPMDGRRHRQPEAEASSAIASSGLPAESRRTGSPACLRAAPARPPCCSARSMGALQRVEAVGDTRVLAVAGEQELHQVVGADREEIRLAQRSRRAGTAARAPPPSRRASGRSGSVWPWRSRWLFSRSHDRLGAVELVHGRDHREHDLERRARRPPSAGRGSACAAGPAGRARCGSRASPAPGSPPRPAHVGQHLVAADVERAEGDRPVAGRSHHRAVERVLLAGARAAARRS